MAFLWLRGHACRAEVGSLVWRNGRAVQLPNLGRKWVFRGQLGEEGELTAAGVPFDSSGSSGPGTLPVCPTPFLWDFLLKPFLW